MVRFAALLLPLLALVPACAPASPLVRVDLVDREDGRWLETWRHRGDDWVAGTPGHRYAVRLVNTSPERVLVVLSVDGVNAITGEDAAPSQAGYVLAPYQSTEVAGWRKSNREVAAFVFTDHGDSYASRTGRPRNVGVVGVAVFQERSAPTPWRGPWPVAPQATGRAERDDRYGEARPQGAAREEAYDGARSASAPAAMPEARRQQIGTGHGERTWAPVRDTTFERASSRPAQVASLRYDTWDRLMALGVVPRPSWRGRDAAPQPFPAGYVPDPPSGW